MADGTQILHTRLFSKKFLNCLSRRPCELSMVVPFVGIVRPWKGMSDFAAFLIRRECRFSLLTRPPGWDTAALSWRDAEYLATHGVDLAFRTQPNLHSKIYRFTFREGDRAAFVGSANFTAGGFYNNDETVAFFREKEENDAVEREINRLASTSTQYQHWRAKQKC